MITIPTNVIGKSITVARLREGLQDLPGNIHYVHMTTASVWRVSGATAAFIGLSGTGAELGLCPAKVKKKTIRPLDMILSLVKLSSRSRVCKM